MGVAHLRRTAGLRDGGSRGIGHRRLRGEQARLASWWWALGLLVAAPLALFALLTAVVVRGTPSWDWSILQTVARHQGHRAAVQVISAFGSWEVVSVLLCVTLGLLLGARLNRQALFVVTATLASMAASGIMKVVVARPRPRWCGRLREAGRFRAATR